MTRVIFPIVALVFHIAIHLKIAVLHTPMRRLILRLGRHLQICGSRLSMLQRGSFRLNPTAPKMMGGESR